MPDTGPPWNIPYVDPADIVRDYPQASEDLADAIAAGLSAAGNPGIGSNVVIATKTDTFATAVTAFTDVPDLSLTFTPTSDTSKVLLIAYVPVAYQLTGGTQYFGIVTLARNGTDLNVPASPGSRKPAFATANTSGLTNGSRQMVSVSMTLLDSPGTTSPITYSVQVLPWDFSGTSGQVVYVNRSQTDSNDSTHPRSIAQLIAIEVAA